MSDKDIYQTFLIIGIVVVDVAGRIHIPHIVSIAGVRDTGYYGSYPILNTQSVNIICTSLYINIFT